ncbi:hypothetical protein P3W85_19560 [Cupriavidus basilensis]|uniref:TolC family protein n=1 Tax=Cupriavidus basilensis TaxID=68895 RepID=A0ABT6AR93_9BURK|nr:hypothetical protein [Cupriavidus basilensis]MDF3835141.1 hypothetical protein [Cupriavidus basilensis]
MTNAAARAGRAYAAGETSLSELLVIRRSLADTALAARLAAVNAREAEEKLRLDLHLPSRFD